MIIKIGCDIVFLPRFDKAVRESGKCFLDQLFTPYELAHTSSVASLAGLFAAKEATIKALELTAGIWHAIEVHKKESGRPYILVDAQYRPKVFISNDLSISHDGEYVMATTSWLFEC